MTDEERREAERLAEQLFAPFQYEGNPAPLQRGAFVAGYAAGRESMRAVVHGLNHYLMQADSDADYCREETKAERARSMQIAKDAMTLIDAERARSAELLSFLQTISEFTEDQGGFTVEFAPSEEAEIAKVAIARYEAGK